MAYIEFQGKDVAYRLAVGRAGTYTNQNMVNDVDAAIFVLDPSLAALPLESALEFQALSRFPFRACVEQNIPYFSLMPPILETEKIKQETDCLKFNPLVRITTALYGYQQDRKIPSLVVDAVSLMEDVMLQYTSETNLAFAQTIRSELIPHIKEKKQDPFVLLVLPTLGMGIVPYLK